MKMDRIGYLKKDRPQTKQEVNAMMRWIRKLIKEGMTIPEAMWNITCVMQVAVDNVRLDETLSTRKKLSR